MNAPLSLDGVKSQTENIVLDWNKLQRYEHYDRESIQIRGKLAYRHIRIENACDVSVGIAIVNYLHGDADILDIPTHPLFTLKPKETKELAVNELVVNAPPTQCIFIYRPEGVVSKPHVIKSDSNAFIIRHNNLAGGYYVQRYYTPTYRAS